MERIVLRLISLVVELVECDEITERERRKAAAIVAEARRALAASRRAD